MEAHLRQQLARIQTILCSNDADELLINGSRGSFMVSGSLSRSIEMPFSSVEAVAEFARELAWSQSLRLDPYHPATGGSVDEFQLRWHAVTSPLAQDEIIFSVRRHRFVDIDVSSFLMSGAQFKLIDVAIHNRLPMLIAGATGVGKTTFLVSLLKSYFLDARVIIMEALSEIPPLSPKWLRLSEAPAQASGKGAISLSHVGRECLRLRPDVLVVGEIRGTEAEIFFDMSQTGHGGSLATIHAGGLDEAKRRLMRLAGAAGQAVPEDFQILGIHLTKATGGGRPLVADVKILDVMS